MAINQSLSLVNLDSSRSQAFCSAQTHTLSLPIMPLLVFCTACVSFKRLSNYPRLPPHPSSSHTYLMSVSLSSAPTLSHCLHFISFLFFCPLSPLPPASLSLCYVCCLAALSFTCQLGSGLWSSNMTNCPLIHLHAHTHTLVASFSFSLVFH